MDYLTLTSSRLKSNQTRNEYGSFKTNIHAYSVLGGIWSNYWCWGWGECFNGKTFFLFLCTLMSHSIVWELCLVSGLTVFWDVARQPRPDAASPPLLRPAPCSKTSDSGRRRAVIAAGSPPSLLPASRGRKGSAAVRQIYEEVETSRSQS